MSLKAVSVELKKIFRSSSAQNPLKFARNFRSGNYKSKLHFAVQKLEMNLVTS